MADFFDSLHYRQVHKPVDYEELGKAFPPFKPFAKNISDVPTVKEHWSFLEAALNDNPNYFQFPETAPKTFKIFNGFFKQSFPAPPVSQKKAIFEFVNNLPGKMVVKYLLKYSKIIPSVEIEEKFANQVIYGFNNNLPQVDFDPTVIRPLDDFIGNNIEGIRHGKLAHCHWDFFDKSRTIQPLTNLSPESLFPLKNQLVKGEVIQLSFGVAPILNPEIFYELSTRKKDLQERLAYKGLNPTIIDSFEKKLSSQIHILSIKCDLICKKHRQKELAETIQTHFFGIRYGNLPLAYFTIEDYPVSVTKIPLLFLKETSENQNRVIGIFANTEELQNIFSFSHTPATVRSMGISSYDPLNEIPAECQNNELKIGYSIFKGKYQEVSISIKQLSLSLICILGRIGRGKSYLTSQICLACVRNHLSIFVLDPSGMLVNILANLLTKEEKEKVLLLKFGGSDVTPGLDFFSTEDNDPMRVKEYVKQLIMQDLDQAIYGSVMMRYLDCALDISLGVYG